MGHSCTFAGHAIRVLTENFPRWVESLVRSTGCRTHRSSFLAHIHYLYHEDKFKDVWDSRAPGSLQEKKLGPSFYILVHVFSREARSQMEAICSPTVGLYGAVGLSGWGSSGTGPRSPSTSSEKRYQGVDTTPMSLPRSLLMAGPEEPF